MTEPLILVLALLCAAAVAGRVGDGWGTNIHWTTETQPGEAAMLAKAFRIARMDLTWAHVEHKCGEYNFAPWDSLLKTMKEHSIRPYWILDYANPCYPGTKPGGSCDTPTCIAAYGRFAAAVVARYKGNGIIFEAVNEPNGMGKDNATVIAALCKAAWPAFEAVNETFVGPASAGISLIYLFETFEAGILSHVSGISVHPYRLTGPETSLVQYWLLKEMLKLFNSSLKIINGEWGYTTARSPCWYPNRVDLETQGKYVPRMWLTSILAGAAISIDYDWHDDGPDLTKCEHNFGSVFYNATGNASQPFVPKPAYHAALALQQGIGNCDYFDKRVDAQDVDGHVIMESIFVLRFVKGSNSDMYAVWHDSIFYKSCKIKFSTSASVKRCWTQVDTFGERLGVLCSNDSGTIAVEASTGPLYLLGPL